MLMGVLLQLQYNGVMVPQVLLSPRGGGGGGGGGGGDTSTDCIHQLVLQASHIFVLLVGSYVQLK